VPEFVVLLYHDGMAVPRQGVTVDSGRTNQKRRTREALVQAARRLLDAGETPTVAQAAEAASVGRTTAYRYFPTQESLLLELAVHADVDEIEDLVAQATDVDQVDGRVREVLGQFNRHVLADEIRFRTSLRLYADLWLTAHAAGDDAPVVREGRRRRWLETCLAPWHDRLPGERWDRLVAALTTVAGSEAMIVLRDVCHLDADEAVAVSDWAVAALLAAARAGEP
jgi:AcrR family transcriptional regulator